MGRLEGRRADEDRYRCFAWERAREADSRVDYHMALSGDATCNGVFSAHDGSTTLKIKKGKGKGVERGRSCLVLFTFVLCWFCICSVWLIGCVCFCVSVWVCLFLCG